MNRYLLGAGVALAAALSWADAQAQLLALPTGPGAIYFGAEGGWTSLGTQTGKAGTLKVSQSFKDGYNVGVRAGYEWGPLRLEEELRYQRNSISSPLLVGPGRYPLSQGSRQAYAIMTNVIYDVTLGWPVTPHIGAGIGVVDMKERMTLRPGIVVAGRNGELASSNDWELGYQAIAGVRYNVNPALAFDIDYRYLATTDASFRTVTRNKYSSGYGTHNIVASLSVKFGAPPPPPPAVRAPEVPPAAPVVTERKYTVFFDWDKDTLTAAGNQVVQKAAADWRAGNPVTIQVVGYTDLSGSAGYNMRLSQRRANTVANALARSGVPRQNMVVQGRGESNARVPTAKGVREPLNRRVEIIFP